VAVIRSVPGTDAWVLWTEASDGDQRAIGLGDGPGPAAGIRAAGLLPPWPIARLRQVHGARVRVFEPPVLPPASPEELEEGDAVAVLGPGAAAAVLSADCLPLVLVGARRALAAVHVGWRGLLAGVIDAAVAALKELDPGPLVGVLGPAIGPCCYAFSETDLEAVEAATGGVGRSRTRFGQLALDLRRAAAALARGAGVTLVEGPLPCTSCSPGYFSHRARADQARQATVVWRGWEPTSA